MQGRVAAAFLACAMSLAARADFGADADASYRRLVEEERAHGRLDASPAEVARLRRILSGLACAAASDAPDVPWQVHTTEDRGATAFALASGGILVGTPFLRRMRLDDAEVAMLLAHEMAHVIAGHRRARERDDEGFDPAARTAQAAIAIAQEDEADRIGLTVARRAGWPADALLRFFDKVDEAEGAGTFSRSHRKARERAEALRTLPPRLEAPEKKRPGSACSPPGQEPTSGGG